MVRGVDDWREWRVRERRRWGLWERQGALPVALQTGVLQLVVKAVLKAVGKAVVKDCYMDSSRHPSRTPPTSRLLTHHQVRVYAPIPQTQPPSPSTRTELNN